MATYSIPKEVYGSFTEFLKKIHVSFFRVSESEDTYTVEINGDEQDIDSADNYLHMICR